MGKMKASSNAKGAQDTRAAVTASTGPSSKGAERVTKTARAILRHICANASRKTAS